MAQDTDDTERALPTIVRMVGDDHAVVLGEPETIRRLGLSEFTVPEPMMAAVRALATAAPGLAALAANMAGDVVRLTPQSLALLRQHGGLIGRDGAMLGVVQAADGKFAGVLAFQAIGPIAHLAPALPVLLSAMAVQAQLIAIDRKLDDLQIDVDTIIRDGHIEVLAEARAALNILEDVHGDVIASGRLTDANWDRVVQVELTVRKLHDQASAHLRDLDHILADADGGLNARLMALRRAARHNQAGFWFQAYVVAETAVAKWDFLHLVRLTDTGAPNLAREVDEVERRLGRRREFVVGLSRRLTVYLAEAGKVDGLLQRVRIIARARLERLIVELDGMLRVYREWVPEEEVPEAVPAETPPALATDQVDELWAQLAARTRRHSGTLARRAGDLAERTGTTIARAAKDPAAGALRLIRGGDSAPDREPDDSPEQPG